MGILGNTHQGTQICSGDGDRDRDRDRDQDRELGLFITLIVAAVGSCEEVTQAIYRNVSIKCVSHNNSLCFLYYWD